MWLPKDERRLLAGYYSVLGEVGKKEVYRISDLRSLLSWRRSGRKIRKYGDSDGPTGPQPCDNRKWIDQYFDQTNRIKKANKHLGKRGLLVVEDHQHEIDVIVVSLTLDGYDLGRQYFSWISRSSLWFDEYRNHWLWLIAACVGGGVASKLCDVIVTSICGMNTK